MAVYTVYFRTTFPSSAIVEADSAEDAAIIVESGQYNRDEISIDYSYGEPESGSAEVMDEFSDDEDE